MLTSKNEELKAKDEQLKAHTEELKAQAEQIATLQCILRDAKHNKIRLDMAMYEKESILSKMQKMHQDVNAAYTAELTRLKAEIATLKETVIFNDNIFETACGIIDNAIDERNKLRIKLQDVTTLADAMKLLHGVITFSLDIPPKP